MSAAGRSGEAEIWPDLAGLGGRLILTRMNLSGRQIRRPSTPRGPSDACQVASLNAAGLAQATADNTVTASKVTFGDS